MTWQFQQCGQVYMKLPTFPQMFYLFSSLPLEAMHEVENHLSSSVILPVPMEEKIKIEKQNKIKQK